jgi:hypothetical protein
MTFAKELSNCEFDLMGVQDVRWDRGWRFTKEKEMIIMN